MGSFGKAEYKVLSRSKDGKRAQLSICESAGKWRTVSARHSSGQQWTYPAPATSFPVPGKAKSVPFKLVTGHFDGLTV